MAAASPEGWECPNHPWHGYAPRDPLVCRYCGEPRTAADALVSLVAGWEGWSDESARRLVDQHAAESRAELAASLAPAFIPADQEKGS